MKFGEHLRRNLTSEWSSQYLDYEGVKELLYDIVSKAPLNGQQQREEHFLDNDRDVFQFCEKECSKINTFFAEKLAQALLRFDALKSELEEQHLTYTNALFLRTHSNGDQPKPVRQRRSSRVRHRKLQMNEMKLALSEFYLMLILLQKYQTLNYDGFCKILKKHDKLFQSNTGSQWRVSYIDCAPFHQSSRVEQLLSEVENLYTNEIEHGNRSRAMARLRVPPLEEKQSVFVTFRLGMFLGMLILLIPLLLIVSLSFYASHSSKSIDWRAGLHLYRSSFLVLVHLIFFGVNLYGWSKNGINHVLIFELDPRNHFTYQRILEVGTFLLVCWFLSFILFLVTFYFDAYPFLQPLIFTFALIFYLFNPLPIFARQSRMWFLRKLFRVFLSPFYPVEFTDFWLGDQLCSLELVFFDLEYFICFYINEKNFISSDSSQTFVCIGWFQVVLQSFFFLLPSWFRFCQCLRRYRDTKQRFPHLVNAGKYASTFFVTLTNALRRTKNFDYHQHKLENPFFYLWILMSLFSSTYKVIWDVKMDWGFFDRSAGENRYLRDQIVYPKKIYYYLAIGMNIVFRYIWMINIFLHFNSLFGEYSDIIGFSFAFVEIFRRFIWNFFRLENEHLTNCGQFRAVRDISIRPTPKIDQHFNSEQRITTTTDEIPMTTISEPQPTSRPSFARRMTIAEEFFQEMNEVLVGQIDAQSNETN